MQKKKCSSDIAFTEKYLGRCQTSMIVHFLKILEDFQLSTNFVKSSIKYIQQDPKYMSVLLHEFTLASSYF